MSLPFLLAGPILRRVEPRLVSVWLALKEPATVKLSLWEGGNIKTGEKEPMASGPDPAAATIRIGERLHLLVVSLELSEGKKLQPDKTYSYDLTIQSASGTQTLKSLGLLKTDPPNATPNAANVKNLALGFETDVLPTFALPPSKLTDLQIAHGSCRRSNANLPDGMAWLDDLLTRDNAYQDPLKRPHQLFLTGDQIYADDVAMVQLELLVDLGKELFGKADSSGKFQGIEQLPIKFESGTVTLFAADQINFPPRQRLKLIVNNARMTSHDGHSHLMSLAEFSAMYLTVWSNGCWPDTFPPVERFLPPLEWVSKIPANLKPLLDTPIEADDADAIAQRRKSYQSEVAALTEFRRTLPKVRRALANIPTYMVFDDHEITDDWYLNPIWRDRVLTSPLGKTILRNGLVSYALFQGWGNDPLKFKTAERKQLLDQTALLFPANATTGPNETAGNAIDILLGFNQNTELEGANPPVKWHYSIAGAKHLVLVMDNRTRRSYVSRVGPPGNVAVTIQSEQIPPGPLPDGKEVLFVIPSLPVLGPSMFDELIAPASYRAYDVIDYGDLQGKPEDKTLGTKGMVGTNPDAIEAWAFDAKTCEALLRRVAPYRKVIFLSGDVHYAASNAMSYWKRGVAEPARFVQFISSGLKNVMPEFLRVIDRTLAFGQRLIRAEFKADRLGWDVSASELFKFPDGSTLVPALKSKLKQSPVLVPTQILPAGTTINQAKLPDWSWRTEVLLDKRPDAQRPEPARPDPLDRNNPTADVQENVEGYRRVANRHFRQMEKLGNARQVLFANNLGVIRFEKRPATPGGPEILFAIQDLYAVHADPASPTNEPPTPQIYTQHSTPLESVGEQRPEDKLKPGS